KLHFRVRKKSKERDGGEAACLIILIVPGRSYLGNTAWSTIRLLKKLTDNAGYLKRFRLLSRLRHKNEGLEPRSVVKYLNYQRRQCRRPIWSGRKQHHGQS